MAKKADPIEFLDREVLPVLFEQLDSVFPEFGWERDGRGWKATNSEHTRSLAGARGDRVVCHIPSGFLVHGGANQSWLTYVNSGTTPRGAEFFEALKRLAALVGVDTSPLDRAPTEEEAKEYEARTKRRSVLEAVQTHASEHLRSKAGIDALAYLRKQRGLTDAEIEQLGLGLYPPAKDLREKLTWEGHSIEAAEAAGLLRPMLEGFVVIPWADLSGNPFTVHTRWPGTPPLKNDHPGWVHQRNAERANWEQLSPEEKSKKPWKEPEVPKTLALPGEGLKSVPMHLDRAYKAKHKDIVAVEGVFDAALPQLRGDSRVVALSGATITEEQAKTLARCKIRSVTLVPDPDDAGNNGAAKSVAVLAKAGITAYVAAGLPEGVDPDKFVRQHGIDAWKRLISQATSGLLFQGSRLLEGITPDSPIVERDRAIEQVIDLHDSATGPRVPIDQCDLLKLLAERTGCTFHALREQAESVDERKRRERQQRGVKQALRAAQTSLEKGADAGIISDKLTSSLAELRSNAVEFPLPFSVDRLEREAREIPVGRSTGWRSLDALEIQLHAGELAIFGARTGHCKTTAMVNMFARLIEDPQADPDEIFIFYSAEESELRIYHRLLALLASSKVEVDGPDHLWSVNLVRDFLRGIERPGSNYPASYPALREAKEQLREWENRIRIVHRPAWKVTDIEADAHRIASDRPVGGILADYLQRIHAPSDGGKGRRRDEEVSAIARRLKDLSEQLNTPVVAGAQINRKAADASEKIADGSYGEKKVMADIKGRRPQLHHLREGGSEQEADLVIGLLNYVADCSETTEQRIARRDSPTLLEFGVLKNRYGGSGLWAPLAFVGRCGWIRDEHYRGEVSF